MNANCSLRAIGDREARDQRIALIVGERRRQGVPAARLDGAWATCNSSQTARAQIDAETGQSAIRQHEIEGRIIVGRQKRMRWMALVSGLVSRRLGSPKEARSRPLRRAQRSRPCRHRSQRPERARLRFVLPIGKSVSSAYSRGRRHSSTVYLWFIASIVLRIAFCGI